MLTENKSIKPDFKILAVDGGGFKGLYTACLLRELETMGSIREHFDMLCGTSTGGLIILPLSIGRNVDDIVDFYKDWGPTIFPSGGMLGGLKRWTRFAFHKSKYNNTALESALKYILEDHVMNDADPLLCVPSFNFTNYRPRVFKTDHHESLNRDGQLLMREVAMATAAAPLFFPVATCNERGQPIYYIDGGLWANNPALVGMIEAARFFVGSEKPYGSVSILSLEGINPSSGRIATNKYSRSLLGFSMELVEAMTQGQQQSTDHFLRFIIPSLNFPAKYIRIESPKLSAKQSKGVQLDTANKKSIETLIDIGISAGHNAKNRDDVKLFFSEPAAKLYRM